MAIAGKVAIRPMGEFVDGTEYDVLDLVTCNNKLYLSKKPSINIPPSNTDYWQMLIDLDLKLDIDGDSKDNTVSFTSDDNLDATEWTDVSVMESGEKHSSLLQKISAMFKNIRFLKIEVGKKAATEHEHDASDITSGTINAERIPEIDAGKVTDGTFASTGVKAASGTDYTTARIRNIKASTSDLTAGSSSLTSGDIYVVYE